MAGTTGGGDASSTLDDDQVNSTDHGAGNEAGDREFSLCTRPDLGFARIDDYAGLGPITGSEELRIRMLDLSVANS